MSKRHKYRASEIQAKHHRLVLDYRGQDRLIGSEAFAEAWNCASSASREYILRIFLYPDPSRVKKWILKTLVGGLDQYPMSVLRQIARQHQIPNYSRMPKAGLLAALTEKGITYGS